MRITLSSVVVVMQHLWSGAVQDAVAIASSALLLISVAFAVIGPMFGIAYLIDSYSSWMLLLYIPWFLLMVYIMG